MMTPEPDSGGSITTTAPPAATPPPAAPAPSPRAAEIVECLRTGLGDGFVEHHYSATDTWARVTPGAWREAARLCRDSLSMGYLCFIAGIDWKLAPDLGAQKIWDPEAEPTTAADDGPGRWHTGVAGGETRFQVFARLYDVVGHIGVTLKVDAGDGSPVATDAGPEATPRVQSWVPLFRGADWHERETWEMYGIEFTDHPGLRHLYLPGAFEGFPLRKDFPLLAREVKPWPGLVNVEGLPGEDEPSVSGGSADEAVDGSAGEAVGQ